MKFYLAYVNVEHIDPYQKAVRFGYYSIDK